MENRNIFAFGRKNYMLMIAGIVVILLGLIVMAMDGEQYGLGALGITVGPMIVLAGFIIEFFAIFAKDKKTAE